MKMEVSIDAAGADAFEVRATRRGSPVSTGRVERRGTGKGCWRAVVNRDDGPRTIHTGDSPGECLVAMAKHFTRTRNPPPSGTGRDGTKEHS